MQFENPYAEPEDANVRRPQPIRRADDGRTVYRKGGGKPPAQPSGRRKRRGRRLERLKKFLIKWAVLLPLIAFKLALLLPIPLFMVWYSWSIDRNGWFQGDQYEREVAQAMLAGNAISHFEKMEEREITKLYIQNLETPPHSVALGSSRILQLNRALTGDGTFFNAGMIGAEHADVMSSYYLFDRVDCIPDVVIFGIDPWIFSGAPDANTYKRVDRQMYNEFLRYGLGHTDVEVTTAEENWNFWLSLDSPAFFRENLAYYTENQESGIRPCVVEGDVYSQNTDVKMPDGSVLYSVETRERSTEEDTALAQEAITYSFVNCEEFYQLDPDLCALFDEFVRYMQSKGSTVVFFLSPYHPVVYDTVLQQTERYSGFFQVEPWVRQYAAEHNIAVYGSYDPLAVGCDENDFFDGWHVRDTGIAKFFPGVAAAETGTGGEPLAVTPRTTPAEDGGEGTTAADAADAA